MMSRSRSQGTEVTIVTGAISVNWSESTTDFSRQMQVFLPVLNVLYSLLIILRL